MNKESSDIGKGMRFNSGKTQLSLITPEFEKEIGKVLTQGAEKYARNNWQKGMPWSAVTDSMERHLNAFKKGIDYDEESGCLHLAHVAVNAMFIMEYYKIYPQGDDRELSFMKERPKIYLDIDGVLADFESHFVDYLNLPNHPCHDWNDYRFRENFNRIATDEEFWLTIPKLVDIQDIPFKFDGYCTARPIGSAITEQWLKVNNFPKLNLLTVGLNVSKVDVLKEVGCTVFVDDSYDNFVELNQNGIFCFLMTRNHNKRFNVGHRRINSLKEVYL